MSNLIEMLSDWFRTVSWWMITQNSSKNNKIPFFCRRQRLFSPEIKHTDGFMEGLHEFEDTFRDDSIFASLDLKLLQHDSKLFGIVGFLLFIFVGEMEIKKRLCVGDPQFGVGIRLKIGFHLQVFGQTPLEEVFLHVLDNVDSFMIWLWIHKKMIIYSHISDNNVQLLMSSELQQLCSDFKYSSALRNYFHLESTNTLMIEILSPIATICAIINIIFFIKVPNARQPPYDIILMVSIFSIMTIIAYLSTIIYNSVHPPGESTSVPTDFQDFCLGMGSLRVFSQIGIITYNCVFCLYYIFKIKNPLKSWTKENRQMHGLCIVLVTLITGLLYLLDEVGVGMLGICALKVSKLTFFLELGLSILYFIVLVCTSTIFLKYIKKISKYDHRTQQFFKYYLIYTVVVSISYFSQGIVISVLIADCYIGVSLNAQLIVMTIINGIVICLPIINTIIVFFHPEIKKGVVPGILKFFRQKKQKHDQRKSFYDDLLTTGRQTVEIELMEQKKDEDGYLSKLKQRNRVSLLVTILGCLTLQEVEMGDKKMKEEEENQLLINSWNFADKYELDITQQIATFYQQIFIDTIPVVLVRFVSYAPALFKNILYMDKIDELQISLNPHKNLQKIKNNVQADGGRSGQFFYFSYDNKFIIKTISNKELSVLLERLESYHEYFKTERESLIVKIYGVFTTLNIQTGEALHFMVMANLLGTIDKKYVTRVYDLKGSSHQREVFKKDEINEENQVQFAKKTMKDIDFERLEERVWISAEESTYIKKQLKKDSYYFFEKGLIDYSLVVIKVDYNAYSLDFEEKQSKEKTVYYNKKRMIKSQKQPGFVYILGIIDYLQTWNVKKKGQKWYKSLWTKSQSISSQNPDFYCERFCENLVDKIFP